jgi:hypothetical protein
MSTQQRPFAVSGSTRSPDAYETFQKKEDGAIKFVIEPNGA